MAEAFEGWAVLELMGHRRLAGRVAEAEIAGAKFLRIDVPGPDGATVATQFYGAAAINCLTPTTEAMARAAARSCQPEPVARWELPAAPPVRQPAHDASTCGGAESCFFCARADAHDDDEDADDVDEIVAGYEAAARKDSADEGHVEIPGDPPATVSVPGSAAVSPAESTGTPDAAGLSKLCRKDAGCIRDAGHAGDCDSIPF